jgi:hypothetical protein
MNSPDNKETELLRRELELLEREDAIRQRENAIRLLEIEKELDPSVPIYQTSKHEVRNIKLKLLLKKLTIVAQFTGIVIAVGVAVKVSAWLATAVIIGGLSWMIFTIVFDKDSPTN